MNQNEFRIQQRALRRAYELARQQLRAEFGSQMRELEEQRDRQTLAEIPKLPGRKDD